MLLIRFSLAAAYFFVVLLTVSGYTTDGAFGNYFSYDAIPNALIGVLHAVAVVRFVLDDKRTVIRSPEQQEIYRYLYHRCGIKYQLEFSEIYERGCWLELAANQELPDCRQRLYLVVQGLVNCSACYDGVWTHNITKRSGDLFDFRLLNVFFPIGFANQRFTVCHLASEQ